MRILRFWTAFLTAACLLCLPCFASDPDEAILAAAARAADRYDVPLALVLAVCETESDFDPLDGNGTCEGLMGLHKRYAGEFARAAGLSSYDLYDISDNLTIGTCILAGYWHTYVPDMALMCYNLGEAGARAARNRGVTSTRYSRLVQDRMDRYSDLDAESAGLRTEAVSLAAGAPIPGAAAAPPVTPAAASAAQSPAAPAVTAGPRYAPTALDRPRLAFLM